MAIQELLECWIEDAAGVAAVELPVSRDGRTVESRVHGLAAGAPFAICLRIPPDRSKDLSIEFDVNGRSRGTSVFHRQHDDGAFRIRSTTSLDWDRGPRHSFICPTGKAGRPVRFVVQVNVFEALCVRPQNAAEPSVYQWLARAPRYVFIFHCEAQPPFVFDRFMTASKSRRLSLPAMLGKSRFDRLFKDAAGWQPSATAFQPLAKAQYVAA